MKVVHFFEVKNFVFICTCSGWFHGLFKWREEGPCTRIILEGRTNLNLVSMQKCGSSLDFGAVTKWSQWALQQTYLLFFSSISFERLLLSFFSFLLTLGLLEISLYILICWNVELSQKILIDSSLLPPDSLLWALFYQAKVPPNVACKRKVLRS